jgi:hypothetical protein
MVGLYAQNKRVLKVPWRAPHDAWTIRPTAISVPAIVATIRSVGARLTPCVGAPGMRVMPCITLGPRFGDRRHGQGEEDDGERGETQAHGEYS